MPFSSGVFANIAGATSAVSGQIIQSTTWNGIHADYSEAINVLADSLANETSFRNVLWMNGAFDIWQRNTSISVSASATKYTADRWYIMTDANEAHTVSRQSGLSTNSQYCARVQRTAAETGTTAIVFGYPLDTDEIYKLRGKTLALTAKLRAGANWSPASGTVTVGFATGTGSPAKRGSGSGFTGATSVISGTSNLTPGGAVADFSSVAIVTVPTDAAQAEIFFTWTPVGTAGAADYIEIDDVQLVVVGVSDTDNYIPYEFELIPFNEMVEGCRRFYQKSFGYGSAAGYDTVDITNSSRVWAQAAERIGLFCKFPIEMRSAPDMTLYPIASVSSSVWIGTNISASYSATLSTAGESGIFINSNASVSAANAAYAIHYDASAGI